MIRGELAHRAQQLSGERVPFVLATVVRARQPTSVRAGDSAIVLGDGTIEGFVGGTCATSSVRLHSLRAHAEALPGDLSDDAAVDIGDSRVARAVGGINSSAPNALSPARPCFGP